MCLARGSVANEPRPVSVENVQARNVTSPGDWKQAAKVGGQDKKGVWLLSMTQTHYECSLLLHQMRRKPRYVQSS
jgi:hypothetical protein